MRGRFDKAPDRDTVGRPAEVAPPRLSTCVPTSVSMSVSMCTSLPLRWGIDEVAALSRVAAGR
jgi:hypothetical protein